MRVFCGEEIAMGPGKAALLEAIAETGSISAASRAMGMSYRRAWLLVDTMNRCFKEPLVITEKGGPHGGGAGLSDLGVTALRRYRNMERKADRAATADRVALASLLAKISK